ncbi:MAG TPA: hypothetical protein VGF99_06920, partial [Myxococcota bacterium]
MSTDRVVWALGARRVLAQVDGTERAAFADDVYSAVVNTLAHDRGTIFDAVDGLYRGEQSFLDWREQTYPAFVRDDVVAIAMGKALGTNLLHLAAIELARDLATERNDVAARDRFATQASDLRTAIVDRFTTDEGLLSSYIPSDLDPAPVRRLDALSTSLAILMDVVDADTARELLSRQPHYGPGVPVIWPQQQDTAIYHNRAEWPFVTAYWLKAAAHVDHDVVVARMLRALVRGSTLHLSNMENFEAGSGSVHVDEGATSGPVVNSRRQLWSVAGALGAVEHTLFGLEATSSALRVSPYVPASLFRAADGNEALLGGTRELVLRDVVVRGRTLTVVLHLPATPGTNGALRISNRQLDGVDVGEVIPFASIADGARIDVTLASADRNTSRDVLVVDDADYRNVFGPRTPSITAIDVVADRLRLTIARGNERAEDITLRVYRDGSVVADALPGSTTTFTDPDHVASSPRTPCYVVESTFASSGTHSQHASPQCFWGTGFSRITTIGAQQMSHVGGSGSTDHG